MRIRFLPPPRLILSAGFAAAFAAGIGLAKDTVSPAVGFLRFDCLSGSDTPLSVPFQRPARWSGRLGAAPAVQGTGSVRVTLAGTPAFAAGELLAARHLLFIRDSAGPVGRHFLIIGHTASTIDLAASPGFIDGLAEGDLVSVVPGWTLATLFPPATQTTFHPSGGPLATQRGSELLFYNNTGEGTGLAPSRRFFVTSSGWFEVGDYAAADEVAILPGQAFVVRHREGAAATTFVPFDEVPPSTVSLPVAVSGNSAQESSMAPPRPVTSTLDQLGLADPVFTESASSALVDRKDELLVFDGVGAGINRGPSAVYFRSGGQWLRDTAGFPVSGTTLLEPSEGLLIRKAPGTAPAVLWWNQLPVYDLTAP